MRRPRLVLVLAAALAALMTARVARADDDHRLEFRDEWPRFTRSEYIWGAGVWSSYLIVELSARPIEQPNWKRALPGDIPVRNALVARTRRGRETAGTWSDVLWIGTQIALWTDSVALPVFLDDFNFDVAAQLALMNLEAQGPTGLISRLAHRGVGRERPSKIGCRQDKNYEAPCGLADAAGFPSGHASSSFAAAGLSCAHHQHVGLYGHPAADGAMCALMLSAGATAGLLRIVADRHWVSDVVVGAAMGLALGYGLPNLLHYGYEGPLARSSSSAIVPATETAPMRFPFRIGWSY